MVLGGTKPGGDIMKCSIRIGISVLAVLLLTLSSLVACGSGDDEDNKTPTPATSPTDPPEPTELAEEVTITIGNLTDLTAVASAAFEIINLGINDMVDYYNENNLIPGVEVKVITYDGQYDPSRDIPGWEWLLERGADVIFAGPPHSVITLQSRADNNEVLLFTTSAGMDLFTGPGYLFSLGSIPQYEAWTLLKWIAENHWDYETSGPAKIGGAMWESPYDIAFFDAMKEYAEVHPDQFEFVGGYGVPFGTFTWGPEINALKDADYVFPCTACLTGFAKDFRNADGQATLIGNGAHVAFMGMVDDARAWDEIDGMLYVLANKWWTDEGDLVELSRELLYEKHPDSAEGIIRSGTGYLTVYMPYVMLEIIRDAAETVGPENIDSQALYESAVSFSLTADGVDLYSFEGKTIRSVSNYYIVQEAKVNEKDLFSVSDWLPIVVEP